MSKLNNLSNKKTELIIFITSMFIFLTLGILLSYTFDFTHNLNLLFESDTSRVIQDITIYQANHYRIAVHPLMLIIMQPLYWIIYLFFQQKMLSIIVLSSIASSITTVFIYKILSLFSEKNTLKLPIVLVYLLSFSTIIFTAGIEIYNFATVFLVMLFYYFIKIMKCKKEKISTIKLIILGVLTFAFTITNYMIFLIIIFVLLIAKKLEFLHALKIVLLSLIVIVALSGLQSAIWPQTPFILSSNYQEEKLYSDYHIGFKNISSEFKNDYANSFISSDLKMEVKDYYEYNNNNYIIDFKDSSFIQTVLIVSFYLVCIIVVIRNFKKNTYINLALGLSLLFNSILHLIYGNDYPFIYSLHFTYLICLLLGINLLEESQPIIKNSAIWYLVLFIIGEIIFNIKHFFKIIDIISNILNYKYLYQKSSTLTHLFFVIIFSLIITIFIFFIIYFTKKAIENKNKKSFIPTGIVLALLIGFSIGFNYLSNNVFQNIYIGKNNDEITSYLFGNLSTYYKQEYKMLQTYNQEYNTFIETYKPKMVDGITSYDFYYFGLGNRKKLLFDTAGLLDIESNKYLYEFNIKEYLIIPNMYTVIIETEEGDFIKIYEDRKGIYYKKNSNIPELIEGTNINIDLYDFKDQEYSEIKKVLYSEILFNIKDNKIYPNIFVYDNVWYRDAALCAMVLKQTNNTDLISEWVKNITQVYDKQNKGVEEPDNLGELLYIISTQKKYNTNLISKIEKEAKKLADKNGGKYISGQTDYRTRSAYQNIWYKLGIESIGKKFTFDLTGLEDNYESLTWWSDYKKNSYPVSDYGYEFPYLSMGQYHKLKKGDFYVNDALYPLSWEAKASEANYKGLTHLGDYYVNNQISPLHTWTSSEMLLFLLDETGDLK